MKEPWTYAVKQWPGMPESWRDLRPERVCKRGIECTGMFTHSYMESGFCSHHCRLAHNALMKGTR